MTMSSITPTHSSWQRAYSDIKMINDLDSSFASLKADIEKMAPVLQKQVVVRVKAWLKKLSEETTNIVWKKNRNNYAKCLLHQLRSGRLEEPFTVMPPGAPLPTLPKSLVSSATKSKSPPKHHQPPVSPSAALDDYLGRHGLKVKVPPPSSSHVTHEINTNNANNNNEPTTVFLPGTAMHLPPPIQTRSNTGYVQDARWQQQPTKLELETRLGASKERQAELEWRLKYAEEQIRRQGHMLHEVLSSNTTGGSPSLYTTNTGDNLRVRMPQTHHHNHQQQSSPQQHYRDVDDDSITMNTAAAAAAASPSIDCARDIPKMLDEVETAISKGKQAVYMSARKKKAKRGVDTFLEEEEEECSAESSGGVHFQDDDEVECVCKQEDSLEEQELLQTLNAFQNRTTALRQRLGSRLAPSGHPATTQTESIMATPSIEQHHHHQQQPTYYNTSNLDPNRFVLDDDSAVDTAAYMPPYPYNAATTSSSPSELNYHIHQRQQQQQQPKKSVRAPIGPETRHTAKSAAAAAAAAASKKKTSPTNNSNFKYNEWGAKPDLPPLQSTTTHSGGDSIRAIRANNYTLSPLSGGLKKSSLVSPALSGGSTSLSPSSVRDWESTVSSLAANIGDLKAQWSASMSRMKNTITSPLAVDPLYASTTTTSGGGGNITSSTTQRRSPALSSVDGLGDDFYRSLNIKSGNELNGSSVGGGGAGIGLRRFMFDRQVDRSVLNTNNNNTPAAPGLVSTTGRDDVRRGEMYSEYETPAAALAGV